MAVFSKVKTPPLSTLSIAKMRRVQRWNDQMARWASASQWAAELVKPGMGIQRKNQEGRAKYDTVDGLRRWKKGKEKNWRSHSFHFCSDETCDRLLHAIPLRCAPSRANLLVFLQAISPPRNNKMAPGVEDGARLFGRVCHFITISRLCLRSISKHRQARNVFGCGLIIKVWKWLVKGGFSLYLATVVSAK